MGRENDPIRRGDALAAIDKVGGANGGFRDVLLKAMIYAMIMTQVKPAEARVLTEHEAWKNATEYPGMPDSCKPVFIEFRSKAEEYEEEWFPPWRLGQNQQDLLRHNGNMRYGKDFRFWDDRPTSQQKENTPWD